MLKSEKTSADRRKKMRTEFNLRGKENGMQGSRFQLQTGISQQQQHHLACAASSNLLTAEDFSHLSESADVDVLSQDFFCTPDYMTPDNQFQLTGLQLCKGAFCPKSPEKSSTVKIKKWRSSEIAPSNPLSPTLSDQPVIGLSQDQEDLAIDKVEDRFIANSGCRPGFVSKSAVALRCRVMPPPCISNPYICDGSEPNIDPYGHWRSKCAGIMPPIIGGDGLSRYHTDFHEIQQIGEGNFNRVFKVLRRIDGCMYAVKHSNHVLQHDTERKKALMEVQALAALGFHENIVAYYSSWFENEQLYIQMELCDRSLSVNESTVQVTEGKILQVLYQIAKALKFIHGKGIAHLDVKPDNIYVKGGVFKLGDFGCATLLDQSLPIEEGDARYMPQEILNENYHHLDKVDIFSLGASIFELIRGARLEAGSKSFLLKEGKFPLLPGYPLQFQNLLKAMVDSDPTRRPSAQELVAHPIFDKIKG